MTRKTTVISYVLYFTGFILFFFYFAWSDMKNVQTFTQERELPALGLAVSSKLEQKAWQYRKAGEALLEEDFIIKWIQTNNSDVPALISFMEEKRKDFEYELIDASIVNDLTETYYSTAGEIIQLDFENKERDQWYYTYREMVNGTNLDSWCYSEKDIIGLFVNIPIHDKNGKYLGVAGGGIDATQFMHTLKTFIKKHNIDLFLIRSDGEIIYSQDVQQTSSIKQNVKTIWGDSVFDLILRNRENEEGIVIKHSSKPSTLFWSVYLPDWNTYLVLERNTIPFFSQFLQKLLRFLLTGGLIIVVFIFIGLFYVKKIWKKTIQQFPQHKKTIQELKAITKIQDNLLRDTQNTLLSMEKKRIAKSFYIQDCRTALKKYANQNSTNTFNTKHPRTKTSKIILEKLLKTLLDSLSTELAQRNIRITAYNTDSLTSVFANESLLSLVIESLILTDYDCGKRQCDVFIAVSTYKGKPSIDISGKGLGKHLSNINLDLEKIFLKEQNAYIAFSEEKDTNIVCHIIFQSPAE